MSISLEQLVMTSYIRYERLRNILPPIQQGSYVDMYIDVTSIIKSAYKSDVQIKNYKALTALIINLCAHYRQFFSYNGIDTTFYIVYSKNLGELNSKFYPEYNSKSKFMYSVNEKVGDIIADNVKLLDLIVPYLPDIHFINSELNFETGAIMKAIWDKVNIDDSRISIILSRDPVVYQLASDPDRTFILRPKKKLQEDLSYCIFDRNAINELLFARHSVDAGTVNISSGLYSTLLALTTVPERNIKSLLNTNSALKIICDCINRGSLQDKYTSYIANIWNALKEYKQFQNILQNTFEYRFKAVDLIFQSNVYKNSIEFENFKFENLYDPDAVRTINNKYFKEIPLDLNAL